MSKKKLLLGIGLLIFIGISIWIFMPYFVSSNNLISRYNYDYTYIQAKVYDYDKLEYSTRINSLDSDKVDKLISVIDELSFKKTWKPNGSNNGWYNNGISFVATYKEDESSTYTFEVFCIRLFEDNVIGFREKPKFREKYYKIQDKEFDIKKVIEALEVNKD